MTQPVIVQITPRVRTTVTNNQVVFPGDVTAGNTIILLAITHNRAATTLPTDTRSTVYGKDYDYKETAYVGWGGAVYRGAAPSTGPCTITLTRDSSDEIDMIALELSSVTGSPLDKTVSATSVTWGTANVTSPSTGTLSQADEIVFALINGRSSVAFTTLPAPSGFTALGSPNLGAGTFTDSPGHMAYQLVSSTSALAPVWAPTGGGANATPIAAVLVVTYKGGAPSPSITGGTTNPVHGSTGNTITGINFGSNTGSAALTIGGQAQTITGWTANTITYTANRGVNLNNVAVNAVVTDSVGAVSSDYPLTGFAVPSGYSYVTLASVNATASYRITAITDLAIGNQLECDNPLVTLNNDGTFIADPSVTSFNVRVGVTVDGWGALAVQTINGGSSTGNKNWPKLSPNIKLGW